MCDCSGKHKGSFGTHRGNEVNSHSFIYPEKERKKKIP